MASVAIRSVGPVLALALAGCFSPDAPPLGTEATSAVATTTDGSESTSEAPGSSSDSAADTTTAGETGVVELCGNGRVDAGEECDLAASNSDNAACTSDCQLATCGDGLLHVGVEECDDANDVDTDACTSSCANAVCGDGLVWAGRETCDGEVENGSCDGCAVSCAADYDDCDGDGASCEVQLCGGTCAAPGPLGGVFELDYTGAVESFVVPPCVSMITIEAWGAQGGDNISLVDLGGRGARMAGDFVVTPGDELAIVVGQRGANANEGNEYNGAGGGGGGTFVWRVAGQEPLVIAGGGGGSSLINDGAPHFWGKDGVITAAGSGSRSHDVFNNSPGGNAGGDGKAVCGAGGNGWLTVLGNPQGQPACNYGGNGGFGGGGGSGCSPNPCNDLHTAGGGGGYSGGGAGGSCYYYGGGGGGSFNAGANQDNASGVRMGNGHVTISW